MKCSGGFCVYSHFSFFVKWLSHAQWENHYKLSFRLLFLTGLFPASDVKTLPFSLIRSFFCCCSCSLPLPHSRSFGRPYVQSSFFPREFSHPNFFVQKRKLLIVALLEVNALFRCCFSFHSFRSFIHSMYIVCMLFFSISLSLPLSVLLKRTYSNEKPKVQYAMRARHCTRWASYKIDDNWKSSK